MLNELLIWGALLAGLVYLVLDRRGKSGALTLAYFLTFSVGHIPGVLAYLDPGFNPFLREATQAGLDTTVIGMAAFCIGAVVAARVLPLRSAKGRAYGQTASAEFFSRIGWRMLVIGVVTYFLVMPLAALVPSLTAISSVTALLLILGFWLKLYAGDSKQTLLTLAMMPLLPLSTLVTGGFLGYGTVWILEIVSFHFVIARRRIWFYIAGPPAIFLGLSLFVTYAQVRDEIRAVVWNENTSMFERLEKVSRLYTDFQFLDPSNADHQFVLDARLNQNWLVGEGIMRHSENLVELLYGATVPAWALIPRAVWPDKPSVGGGGDWVTQFTGITFDESTSVGVGQVLEFYMNFGMPGVLAGFAVLGFILMRLDQQIMCALATGNISRMIRWALPGLALVAPIGNLMEILVACASAVIVSQLLIYSNWLGSLPAQNRSPETSSQPARMKRFVRTGAGPPGAVRDAEGR
jgi:hypothetical protein